ncbi:choice-of-anchor A family protein [Oxalobacteraceae bacterium]|nr:choice-of-anchor A family protein [Oxalobacteraceae bacterium]
MSMMSKSSASVFILAMAAGGAAQAGVLDLGISGANLFSLGNFSASGSDVEGAVVVAGNLTASNYSINDKNADAFGKNNGSGFSLVVGGKLDYSSGSIKHGSIYAGGGSVLKNTDQNGNSNFVASAPVDFNAMASNAKQLSTSLAQTSATGTSKIAYGGMTLTGSNKSVEVFDLKGTDLASVNNFKLAGLSKDATLIFNVSGANAIGFNQNGVGLDDFKKYNVLFNFYQSTALNIQNVGIQGSLLAPLASVTGGSGQINGNVIVGNWLSQVQVNANHYFKQANINGYTAPTPVPEPETYAMLLAGLALVGMVARRRKAGGR